MWGAWLVETMTGRVGARLDLLGGSVETVLNGADTLKIATPWHELAKVDRRRWAPWQASLLIAHACPLLPDWRAWASGPIINLPSAEHVSINGEDTVVAEIPGKGLREMLRYRIETAGTDYTGDVDAVKTATRKLSGMSLGTIGAELVKAALARRGGQLPIRFRAELRETGLTPGHERTFEGFNVASSDVDKLLSNLSEVQGGPDFVLRPSLTTDNGWQVTHDLLHGSSASPHIPQERQLVWDATAPDGPVTGMQIVTDSSLVATRVWATGAGDGAGIAMQVAEDQERLSAGWPLMETVVSSQTTTELATLAQHASGRLEAGHSPTVQANVTVQADHPASVLGTWHVGDRVLLCTPDHPALPAGEYLMTIITASADLGSESVRVHLQED